MILPEDSAVRMRRFELIVWAFLLSLAFYPGIWGFLAWISLARPIVILSRLRGRPAFNSAYLFSFFFNLFGLYWVALVTPPGMIAAVVIVAFYYAFALSGFVRLYHIRPILGYIALPFLWAGLEYFRTLSEFAFPWSDLGYTQSYFLYILQIVSIISVHGLTILIVAVNVLLAQLFRRGLSFERKLTAGLVSAAVVVLLTAYGWAVMPKYPVEGKFEVGLLQGSVPLFVKWADDPDSSIAIYSHLADSIAADSVGLMVWPETAAPCYVTHNIGCRMDLARIAVRTHTPQLIGALAATRVGDRAHEYNSCFEFDSLGRLVERYDKVKLVPFSEHVPYQDYFGFLQPDFLRKYLTFIDSWGVEWWSDFYPGDSLKLFSVDNLQYQVLICFEATFPEFVRQGVRDGASFVVGITNDTWFKRSVGVSMHARIFVTRCVENRTWGARAANTGQTYICDRYGRLRERLGLYEIAALTGKVGLVENYSIFTQIGDVAGKASFLITLLVIGIFIILWVIRITGRGRRTSH